MAEDENKPVVSQEGNQETEQKTQKVKETYTNLSERDRENVTSDELADFAEACFDLPVQEQLSVMYDQGEGADEFLEFLDDAKGELVNRMRQERFMESWANHLNEDGFVIESDEVEINVIEDSERETINEIAEVITDKMGELLPEDPPEHLFLSDLGEPESGMRFIETKMEITKAHNENRSPVPFATEINRRDHRVYGINNSETGDSIIAIFDLDDKGDITGFSLEQKDSDGSSKLSVPRIGNNIYWAEMDSEGNVVDMNAENSVKKVEEMMERQKLPEPEELVVEEFTVDEFMMSLFDN